MSKKRKFLSAAVTAGCAMIVAPRTGIANPASVTYVTGWGLPMEVDLTVDPNGADFQTATTVMPGTVALPAFNPAWGTVVNGSGDGIGNHGGFVSWDSSPDAGLAESGLSGSISPGIVGQSSILVPFGADSPNPENTGSAASWNNSFSFGGAIAASTAVRFNLSGEIDVSLVNGGTPDYTVAEGIYFGSLALTYRYHPSNSFTGNGGPPGGPYKWNNNLNWANGVPNSAGAFAALFGGAAGHDVEVDAPTTIASLILDDTTSYTIEGTNTLTFDATPDQNNPNPIVQLVSQSGSHTISAPVSFARDAYVNVNGTANSITLSNTLTATGVTITKQGAGTLIVNNVRANALDVQYGAVQVAPSGGTSKVTSLAIPQPLDPTNPAYDPDSGQLDLTNNKLIVDYPTAGPSPIGTWNHGKYTGLIGLIAAGRNTGSWNGRGIASSTAAAQSQKDYTELGIAEASDVLGLSGSQTATWGGQTVDATSVLVKYTYGGDANLDGQLTIDDYGALDAHNGQTGVGWRGGDFNYDGIVNVDDYGIIDGNIGNQGPPFGNSAEIVLPAVNAVPEPASIAGLTLIAGTMLARRRRSSP